MDSADAGLFIGCLTGDDSVNVNGVSPRSTSDYFEISKSVGLETATLQELLMKDSTYSNRPKVPYLPIGFRV